MTKHLTESSRRSFFTKSAALFGAGALASKIMEAQSTITPPTAAQTDLDVLNYALSLENLEAAFYNAYAGRYSATDYAGSIYTPVFGSKITGNLVSYIGNIRDHENAHVAALKSTITSLGGSPVAACTYSFGVNNVNDFLATAMALENTGVMAYDGAISMITNLDVRQAAATIATVEARHASYLNVLNCTQPFPMAFDTAKSKADVLAIAGQFITSCPVTATTSNPNGPTIAGLRATITTVEQVVQFDFSKSTSSTGGAVSFNFTQVSGPLASVTGVRASDPQAILLGGKGVYVFQLVVTDSQGHTQTGRTTITYQ